MAQSDFTDLNHSSVGIMQIILRHVKLVLMFGLYEIVLFL